MKKNILNLCLGIIMLGTLSGCFAGKSASVPGKGGEVTGVGRGKSFREPTPYGMTLVKRGWLKMGLTDQDSLWGKATPVKDISVDGFWMDETEVTNSKYKQFVENCFTVLPRQALHAKTLGFEHPVTHEFLSFDSELPDDMQACIEKWRSYKLTSNP